MFTSFCPNDRASFWEVYHILRFKVIGALVCKMNHFAQNKSQATKTLGKEDEKKENWAS